MVKSRDGEMSLHELYQEKSKVLFDNSESKV